MREYVYVVIKRQDDGSLYGSYSFPKSESEKGGGFTAERYGPLLFIKLEDHGMRVFLYITGTNRPEMMYGAIPRASGKTPHATITVFRVKKEEPSEPILGLWQDFTGKGL